ncbi:hypothetical protein D3C78_722570 [compost metagenome]
MGIGRIVLQCFGAGREQWIEQLQVDQHLESIGRMPREEQLQYFFEQAGRRDLAQHRCQAADRQGAVLLDAEVELGGEAHGAQHAHRVFLVALGRVADQADQAVADVVYAVGVIENALADRVVIQGIDGEVAALRVFFQGAVYVVAQNAPAFVTRGLVAVFLFVVLRVIGAEGRDFDDFAAKVDVHQLEAAANDPCVAKLGADLFRRGAGGDVEILGGDVEQHVAHAAADQISLVPGVLQAFDDVHRITAELGLLQRMLAAVEDFRRATNVLRTTQGRTE